MTVTVEAELDFVVDIDVVPDVDTLVLALEDAEVETDAEVEAELEADEVADVDAEVVPTPGPVYSNTPISRSVCQSLLAMSRSRKSPTCPSSPG